MIYQPIQQVDLLPEIQKIAKQAFGHSVWTKAQFEEDWENTHTHYIGAFKRGVLVGYIQIAILFETAEVLNLAVHPQYQQRGIAKQLLKEAIQFDEAVTEWLLEVRESNEIARRVYQAIGFYELSKRRQYYKQPLEDAVIMKLELKEAQ